MKLYREAKTQLGTVRTAAKVKPWLFWVNQYSSARAEEPAVVKKMPASLKFSRKSFLRVSKQKLWSSGEKTLTCVSKQV